MDTQRAEELHLTVCSRDLPVPGSRESDVVSLSCQMTGLTPVKWLPPRPDDEELTSAGTMAVRGTGQEGHRPGDRPTVVFDPGVPTSCGDIPKARSLGRVTGSSGVRGGSLRESQALAARRSDTCSQIPLERSRKKLLR